jgi:dihydroorotate dehydrogenase (NAD+) catalytic subunit
VVDLAVDVGRLKLANPVMPASGTFSDGLARVIDFNRLGAFVIKTVTRELRAGNSTPRVAETAGGMLNSIGIPSKGIDYFFRETLPFYRRFGPPLVASISAPTADGFASLAADISVAGVAAIEANISCPNLEKDGRAFAMTPQATAAVVARLRAATKLPLWVKLTPNTGDIAEVARAAEANGADAVVVANTILAMSIDVSTFRPRLGSITGGLSGPAVKPVILRQVYQCARVVKIDIIGCGGIACGADAVEYMLAGARAVQVGTATFIHPTALIRVIDELEDFCNRKGLPRASALTGAFMRSGADETDVEWRQEAGE